jgi:hypothetical protein
MNKHTAASQEAAKTRALINDLVRIVQILDDAIKAEEELAGVFRSSSGSISDACEETIGSECVQGRAPVGIESNVEYRLLVREAMDSRSWLAATHLALGI